MNKKGKAKLNKSMLEAAVVFIVLVVLFMSVYAVLVPEAQTAGDSMNDTARCTDVGCFYNASRAVDCTANNVSSGDTGCTASASSLPLASLFGGNGVIFVVIMAVLLIVLIVGALRGIKGKK